MGKNTNKPKYLQNKSKKNKAEIQLKKVFKSFFESPKTTWEASVDSNVVRANSCRHVATLVKQNRIARLRQRICKISGHKAWELTTNPELFPKDNQYKLFENEQA